MSDLESCKKEDIDKIERTQRSLTSKIKGLEEMHYHKRVKILNTYSLERKREHFFISNAWQQIEGKKENILGLKTGKIWRRRCIKSATIPTALSEKFRTKIQHSTVRQMERLFNAIPYKLQCILAPVHIGCKPQYF